MKRLLILICTIINAISAQYPDYVQSTNLGTNDLILIAHWNGSSWNQTMSITGTNLMSQIISLIPASTNNIWSVDTNGTIQATSDAPDGQDSFVLNTVRHLNNLSGSLFQVNHGTNELLELYGLSGDNPGGALYLRDDSRNVSAGMYAIDVYGYFDVTYDDGDYASEITLRAGASGASLYLYDSSGYDEVTRIDPNIGDGQTLYLFDTSVAHTSGNLGAFLNDRTNVVQITATTATSTNTPFILNINGTQKEVFLGPVNSAGTGLRALSVVN